MFLVLTDFALKGLSLNLNFCFGTAGHQSLPGTRRGEGTIMTSRKLYMANELPYNKYHATKIDVKLLTWSLAEAKVKAKSCTATFYDKENENVNSDDEEYSSNFILSGGVGIMTVSAEVVQNVADIKSCRVSVLKEFVKATSPPGVAIPAAKKLLLPIILDQLVVGEYGQIIYAEDVAKEKAAAAAYAAKAAARTESASTGEGLDLKDSGTKKRKIDE